MNCQDFNTVVGELADGRLMEAATREAGLEHAAVCVACAAQLMDARGVSAALRVASKAETEEAPARVRQALLAAFAEQRKATAAPATVQELPSRRVTRWRRFGAVGVAAAAAAVLLSLTLPSLLRVSPEVSQVPPPDMRAAVDAPHTEGVGAQTTPNDIKQGAAAKRVAARAQGSSNFARRKSEGRAAAGARTNVQSVAQTGAQHVDNGYLPLTYLADATAMESGTVVRVELSRAALISLGVPVSIERTDDELMKAEVVMGDDGVARAIRLVR